MKKYVFYQLIIFILINMVCSCTNILNKTEKECFNFIKELENKIIPVNTEVNKSSYKAAITGKQEDYDKITELSIQHAKILSNKDDFEKLKNFKESGLIKDKLLKRQVDILYNSFLGYQMNEELIEQIITKQNELEQKFTTHRALIKGKTYSDNQIDSILKKSVNSNELKDAWLASKKIAEEVVDDVKELVKLRNEAAKELGFSNHYEMSLKLDDQDPEEIEIIFNELDALTKDIFKNLKDNIDNYLSEKYNIPKNELMPWHYQNKFFQEAPTIYQVDIDAYFKDKDIVELSKKYYSGLGLNVESIINNSDLYEKEGKNQHAFCMDVDRNGDVRVLANIRPDSYWMNTMLHELGHAVYDKYHDYSLPYFLRTPAHSFTTEAIALMFGRMYSNPQWLQDNIGISNNEKDSISNDLIKNLQLELLVFSRWSQVMFRFEKSMFENPEQDLNKLWWELVEKYQLLQKPEGRDKPDWASKIHISLYPAYYHNYLLGDLLASQLYFYIGKNVLKTENITSQSFTNRPEVGEYLINSVFKPGNRYYWNEMIERATGEKLTAKYYSKQFIGI